MGFSVVDFSPVTQVFATVAILCGWVGCRIIGQNPLGNAMNGGDIS